MLAKKLINSDFTPLQPSSPISAALAKMNAWQTSSIPVVEPTTRKNVGHILFDDVAEVQDESTPVSAIELREPIYTFETQHIFEVARQMLQHEVRILSVVDNYETYLGIIEKKKVLEALSNILNVTSEGSVITVEMARADFTLAELVHLVEQEEAKILGLTVEHITKQASSLMRVSIKLNQQDTSAVTSSLRRHGYTTTTENKQDLFQVDMSSKADELMRYLDV